MVEKINGGCGAAADGGRDTAGHGQRFDNRWARDRAGHGVHLAGAAPGGGSDGGSCWRQGRRPVAGACGEVFRN